MIPISDRNSRSAGASPLRSGIYTGTASYKLDTMSVADELHPVINAGRVAVITGAASGIGKAAAGEFAKYVVLISETDNTDPFLLQGWVSKLPLRILTRKS